MYLIHFYIENNIKMHFPKVEFLRFQNHFYIHYSSQQGEINSVDISKGSTTTVWSPIFPQKEQWIIIIYIYVYILHGFDTFFW